MANSSITDKALEAQITGRKIFFVYPNTVMQGQLANILAKHEYEIYFVNDHKKILKALPIFSESILFANIDEILPADEWVKYAKSIMVNDKTKGVRIGVITHNNNSELAMKFIKELAVPCGFIATNVGIERYLPIMVKILEANGARGRRKYVRAISPDSISARFNIEIGKEVHSGRILDISIAGMAAIFDKPVELDTKTKISDIQLVLKGIVCRVSGVIAGARKDAGNLYVIVFDYVDDKTGEKIHSYIHKCLQDLMDETLKNL